MATRFIFPDRRAFAAGLAPVLVASLVACGPSRPARPAGPAPLGAADYAAPPRVSRAVRAGATVEISGVAAPQARIRLTAPDGSASGTTALDDGRWSIILPAGRPALFSLAQDVSGRTVRARGYLAVLPAPGQPVTMLRPGSGAWTAGSGAALAITAVDFDKAGATVVSGVAPAQSAVRVGLDGADAGEARTGADGRFAASLTGPLSPGPHAIAVQAGGSTTTFTFDAARASDVAAPFAQSRRADHWRLDWLAPGGGVQTTLIADPASNALGAGV